MPAELRYMIFRLVSPAEKVDPWNCSPLASLEPVLLLISKPLNALASVFFYGQRCFDLRLHKIQIKTFLDKIGQNAQNIMHVHIDVNACLDASRLDDASKDRLKLIRYYCGNLKTIIVSTPKHTVSTADAAFNLAESKIQKLFGERVAVLKDTQSPPVNEYHMRASKLVFDACSGLKVRHGCRALRDTLDKHPQPCDKHPHMLNWMGGDAALDEVHYREICLGILRQAKHIKEPRIPDRKKTIISATGKLFHVEWTDFAMTVFNNPKPTNGLQATLALILSDMESYTDLKDFHLGYSKLSVATSELVFSRRDIISTFPRARSLDFDGICDEIRSIRLLDFRVERDEQTEDEKVERARKEREEAESARAMDEDIDAEENEKKKRRMQ